MTQGQWLVAIGVGVTLLFALVQALARLGDRGYPYQRREFLFTRGEREFYLALRTAVGNQFLIFGKVRLGDLLSVRSGAREPMKWVNKIRSKHADFVLCRPDDVAPAMVIELDDASHQSEDARRRDEEKNLALAAAGLPLLRYRARSAYAAKEIAQAIRECLKVG